MDWPEAALAVLPPLLQDFVRIIGLQPTMRLVERFGGLRIYIPMHAAPDHQFSQVIGLDNLAKLATVYGGEAHFQLPKAQRALLALRDEAIRSAFGTRSIRQLAIDYQLTERHVSRIVSSGAHNDLQNSLFE